MTFSFGLASWDKLLSMDASSELETRRVSLQTLLEEDAWHVTSNQAPTWETLLTASDWSWSYDRSSPVDWSELANKTSPQGLSYTIPFSVGGEQIERALSQLGKPQIPVTRYVYLPLLPAADVGIAVRGFARNQGKWFLGAVDSVIKQWVLMPTQLRHEAYQELRAAPFPGKDTSYKAYTAALVDILRNALEYRLPATISLG